MGDAGTLWLQIVTIVATGVFAALVTWIILQVLNATMGLRISTEDEQADRKFKRHFCAGALPAPTLAATPRPHLLPSAQHSAAAPPECPGAWRRAAQRRLDMQLGIQHGRSERHTKGRRPLEGRLEGKIANGIANAQRGETHLHWAHVGPETTCDVVGLGDPVGLCLAKTGRCNGRWNGDKLEMT
jgi:hypothetical protein